MLEEKLTPIRFSSWCNVFDDNVAMLDEKLPYEIEHTLVLLTMQYFNNES